MLLSETSLTVLTVCVLFLKGCNSEWIGDGNCDDENNKEQCNYDGGDCCGENVNKQFCSECICMEETVKSLQIPQPKCSGHYFKANFKIYCTFALPNMGPVNHADAYKACKNFGAQLPIITIAKDQKEIYRRRKNVS